MKTTTPCLTQFAAQFASNFGFTLVASLILTELLFANTSFAFGDQQVTVEGKASSKFIGVKDASADLATEIEILFVWT